MFVIFYPVLSHFISLLGPRSVQLVELMTVSVHMSFGSQRWLLNWCATYVPLVARAKCTTSFISPYTSFVSTIEKASFISALQSFIPYYIDTGFRTLSRIFYIFFWMLLLTARIWSFLWGNILDLDSIFE